MLGFHVHEKAVLTVLIPMALHAVDDHQAARRYMLLSTAGTYALFPLLFELREYPIKVTVLTEACASVHGHASSAGLCPCAHLIHIAPSPGSLNGPRLSVADVPQNGAISA